MKKYDSNAECKKCGHGGIDDKHIEYSPARIAWADYPTFEKVKFTEIPEHIVRTCRNCGYSWRESPVDGDGEKLLGMFIKMDALRDRIMDIDPTSEQIKEAINASNPEYKRCWPTKEEYEKMMEEAKSEAKETSELAKTLDDMHGDKTIRESLESLDPMVIEVGDVVEPTSRLCNLKRECVVSGKKNGAVRLVDPSDSMCSCTLSFIHLTLIRKGPKVHEYGYVEWKKNDYGTIPFVNNGSNEPFDKLHGKKGTLTFKEDTK